MNNLFRMHELIDLINKADKAYFGNDKPIMSDKEYDALIEELTTLEKESGLHFKNSPIGRVGGEVKKGLTPVKHTKPMLSCNKTKNLNDVIAFSKNQDVVLSWKLDGLTLVLRYEKGEFTKAITRGSDGIIGEDVTHTVLEMRNIPLHIPCKESFEVRGEGVISYDDFNFLNRMGEKSTHPRSVASGAVRSLVADRGKLYHIDFFAFELIKENAPSTKLEQLEFLKENNFDVVQYILLETDTTDEEKLEIIKGWKPEGVAYPVDGIVFEYNDIAFGKSLGVTSHHEKRMLALKWKDEVVKTFFRGVSLNTTRNGIVSIVGEFDEVLIDGTRVHRASLHNLSNFEQFEFGEGDLITVYKANMIIPQIADNYSRSGGYELPKFCPSCGEELTIKVSPGGIKDLYCKNSDCIARNANRIARYCDKNAMNIDGLSATTLEKMIANGWIKTYKDLYHLEIHADNIINTPGFGVEKYNQIIEAVNKSRDCLLSKFLVGIGINHLGPEAAKAIHQYFYGSITDFENAIKNKFHFSYIEGVSYNVEEAIYEWYEKPINQNVLHSLMTELSFKGSPKEIDDNNPFYNKRVVVTGTFKNFERVDILNLLESLGATTNDIVSKSTDYLIYGSLPGSKKVGSAISNGIAMLSEDNFAAMLEQNLCS